MRDDTVNSKQVKGTVPFQIYHVGEELIKNKQFKDWSDVLTNGLRCWMEDKKLFELYPTKEEGRTTLDDEKKKRGIW